LLLPPERVDTIYMPDGNLSEKNSEKTGRKRISGFSASEAIHRLS
jgi:hypothetical protein